MCSYDCAVLKRSKLVHSISLVILGIPLMIMELGLGQLTGKNAMDAFGSMGDRFKGVGLAGILAGTLVVLYYQAVIGWCLVMIIECFSSSWREPHTGPIGEYF